MSTPLRILIIDDDEVDRMTIKRALKASEGSYVIDEVDAADKVPEKLAGQTYDCIFLDYLLPGTDGLSVLRKIRLADTYTPVIIITSQGDEGIAVSMMKSGASDYMVKTRIDMHTITHTLRSAINYQEVYKKKDIAERALIISEARLSEAQRIARIGNWEYDLESREMYCSNEVYRIFGIEKKSTGNNIQDFYAHIHPDDLAEFRKIIEDVEKNQTFDIDVRLNVNTRQHANIHGYYISDGKMAVRKIIGTIQDITIRKKIEEELMEAKKIAEESIKTKERFLANMSHEIRTPMNAIIGFAEILNSMSKLSDEQINYIDAIHTSGQNLMVIINDILDFSKVKSGKLTFEKTELNLSGVVNSVIGLLNVRAAGKNLSLTCEIKNNVPLNLIGDPVRLNQVLINILGNAIKFTPDGGRVSLTVSVLESRENNCILCFETEDTGIGIPEEKLESIFEGFTQASDDTARKYGGTGLGLSIVKSIVEIQGGKIIVKSKTGQGTVFSVYLPFDLGQLPVIKPTTSLITDRKDYKDRLEGLHILLVEDNQINQLLVKSTLDFVECRLDIADNGRKALEQLKTKGHEYDLILMDVQVPEMNGHEITAYIRNQCSAPLSDIPIIAMTAGAFDFEYENCIKAGMNDYISKPFKIHELYEKIDRLTVRNKI